MANSDDDIWNRFQTQLQNAADQTTYDVWLSPLRYGGYDGSKLSIAAPAEHRAWISSRFMGLLSGAAGTALGDCEVELVDEGAASAPVAPVAPAPCAPAVLNPKLTFDQFVIGE